MGSCDTVWQEGGECSYERNFKKVPITQVSTASYDKTFNWHNKFSNYFSLYINITVVQFNKPLNQQQPPEKLQVWCHTLTKSQVTKQRCELIEQ